MRICQIVPSLEQRHGGPSKSSFELSAALARAGHDVDLLATSEEELGESAEGSLRVSRFQRDRPRRLCRSAGMQRRLREIRADVIHEHSIWLRTLHYARRAAGRQAAPLVVSPRGMMSEWAWNHHRARKRLAGWLIHPGAFRAVAGWHATSEAEAGEIRSRGFLQPVCVAPNGVASPADDERAAAAAHWRGLIPALKRRPVALFYSRFHPKKRVLELVDLWLERAPADWVLLLVGIPEAYTPEMLEDYADGHGGAGRVVAASGADRPAPYAAASLFLLPSHNENFGLAIAEALAHGVPALVTDTTPWSELNRNGGGWCVPWSGYPDALRAALAEGPERLRQRGEAARHWVLRRYSWDAPAQALAEFYRSLRA